MYKSLLGTAQDLPQKFLVSAVKSSAVTHHISTLLVSDDLQGAIGGRSKESFLNLNNFRAKTLPMAQHGAFPTSSDSDSLFRSE